MLGLFDEVMHGEHELRVGQRSLLQIRQSQRMIGGKVHVDGQLP